MMYKYSMHQYKSKLRKQITCSIAEMNKMQYK